MKGGIEAIVRILADVRSIVSLTAAGSLRRRILNTYLRTFVFRRYDSHARIANILGYQVKFCSYSSLSWLFKELFLAQQYHFLTARPCPYIIDCGSNIGMSVLYFKALYPDSSILAFEPDWSAFACLQENVEANKLRCVRIVPFESPAPYRKRLGPLANVAVDDDGPVQPRIFGAAAVIQRSCTTAIEAGMASVPALSPQWVPTPVVKPVAEAVSEPCASYAELQSRLASILDGSYQQSAELRSEIEGVIHDWFHLSDGRAHERVGEAVARSWSRSRVVDERLCKRYLYGLGEEPVPARVKLGQWVRYATGISPNWSLRRLRRVPFRQKSVKDFGVREVALLAERIEVAWRAAGRNLRPVSVRGAAERSDYANGFMGQSVTLVCET